LKETPRCGTIPNQKRSQHWWHVERSARWAGPSCTTPDLNCDKADLAVAPTPPPAAALAAPVVFTAALQAPGAVVKVEPKLKQTTKRNTKLARPVACTVVPVKKEQKGGQKVPKVTAGGSGGQKRAPRGRGGAVGAMSKRWEHVLPLRIFLSTF